MHLSCILHDTDNETATAIWKLNGVLWRLSDRELLKLLRVS